MDNGVGSLSLLQGIFLTQKSNWGLTHCRQTLYQLSYRGSPLFKLWTGVCLSQKIPSPGDLPHPGIEPTISAVGIPDPGIEPGSPALQADYLTAELPGN